MQTDDWKNKLGQLYGLTTEDLTATPDEPEVNNPTPVAARQLLRVELDKRNGKPATLISGFEGTDDALKQLARQLKATCGAGGSARGGEILIQGDMRVKIADLLANMGYKVKKINFK